MTIMMVGVVVVAVGPTPAFLAASSYSCMIHSVQYFR